MFLFVFRLIVMMLLLLWFYHCLVVSFRNFLFTCCLQAQHWRQIFREVGREYDVLKQYKVEDMMNFHLTVYHQFIDSIVSSAIEAYGVEQRFNKIQSLWMEREFKLKQHFLDSYQKFGQSKILL